ncbi:b-glycosyltransferase [Chryseobacterium sp. FH2]|uniref:glycosyltransferase family 2 protein n=1 Tax=Chryseobacterium sp. FH2 TaxID=1674291 RepID=UPI00065AE953|nr:glycosyltransferase family 2 protein [Chryseobacterium sp. FH2]KMQ68237.1 b-glycosyltransferase [Chryseobacterium sp. FH2]
MISIVSPVYRAEKILPTLVSEINSVMARIGEEYEIILVDDRSPDNSWEIMRSLMPNNPNLKVFRLSRNFGQHATIMAGLTKANGDWIIVMDCDMQDQPKEIEKLYKKGLEGYDVVLARREIRMDSPLKKLSSKIFYKIFNYLAGIEINNEIANFGIYKRKVVRSILNINDNIKFFPLFVKWVGYNSTTVPVEHASREEGKSAYSLSRLISLAFNVIISFSDKPLKIFVGFGATISLLSILVAGYFALNYFQGKITEPGFSSIILSIWFLSGVVISCIGIVGIYLGKTFNQTKNRPVFLIDEAYEN